MLPILEARGIAKTYVAGLGRCWARVEVLRDVTLVLGAGERVLVTGAVGAGKTTLLHCLTGLRRPDAGTVRWRGGAGAPYRLCAGADLVGGAGHALVIVDLPDDPRDAGRFVEALHAARRGWLVLARRAGPLGELAHRAMVLRDGRLLESPAARPRQVAERGAR